MCLWFEHSGGSIEALDGSGMRLDVPSVVNKTVPLHAEHVVYVIDGADSELGQPTILRHGNKGQLDRIQLVPNAQTVDHAKAVPVRGHSSDHHEQASRRAFQARPCVTERADGNRERN